jgi:HD-GYP domain-containing protein (c-di-GMP phosphodiesterase class II)
MDGSNYEEFDLIPLEVEEEELEQSEDVDAGILELDCVYLWQKSYKQSVVPFVILDKQLRILWENNRYQEQFNRGKNYFGEHIIKLFSNFLEEEEISTIYRNVKTEASGFSWRGRLETGGKQFKKIISNTMIFPIFSPSEPAGPVGYGALFDNVTEEYQSLLRSTFLSLLEASKMKDNDTGRHIERVNEYSKTIAFALFNREQYPVIDMQFIEDIGFLAAMHDVGKIGTPDDILNKTGPLDDREWKTMKEHTINGAYILSTYSNAMAKEIALFHHERWDGSGYPYNLAEDMIPLSARIVAIADVYDALRMERSYKEAYSHEKSFGILVQSSGTHFDPELISFIETQEAEFEAIYTRLSD